MDRVKLILLGEARLEGAGDRIDIDTRKAIALLAFLALSGRPHSRDELATFLWPESGQSGARGALRRTLSALRKALPEATLEASRESIGIQAGAEFTCDAVKFRELIDSYRLRSHTGDEVCVDCARILEQAIALYAGDFMTGFSLRDSLEFDNWQFQEAEQFRREYGEALLGLIQLLVQERELDRAVELAYKLLALDPLNESAHRRLMELQAWRGQRESAFRQYRECVRILDEELGVRPLEVTTRLYEAIRTGEFPLREHVSAEWRPVERQQPLERPALSAQTQGTASQATPLRSGEERIPLAGRRDEMESLKAIYTNLGARGHLVILRGENGIGKSRLAEEFLNWVKIQGGRVLRARGYAGETNLAYGAILEALRCGLDEIPPESWSAQPEGQALVEAARLAPELRYIFPNLPAAANLEGPGAQYRFFEGVTQVLLAMAGGREVGEPGGTVFVDDLQWIDTASLELLAYISRRLANHRLLILTTWRTDTIEETQQLHSLLAEVTQQNLATRLDLPRLTADQMEELLHTLELAGKPVHAEWRRRLVQESEGLPLFLVAYLHAAAQSVTPYPINDTDAEAGTLTPAGPRLPAGAQLVGIRDVLQSRLALLDAMAQQVLQTAAVIGRSFDFDTLLAACGRSEDETILALESLAQRGLVREIGFTPEHAERRIIYDFSHTQMRELVYENTSLARRRLLHRRVADSLAGGESRPGIKHGDPALAGQIAAHYRYAGKTEEAARYARAAGEYARRLYANQEAIQHFEIALALGAEAKAELHGAIGDLLTLEGNYAAAIHHYEIATIHSADVDVVELERRLGLVYDRLGEYGQAEQHYRAALEVLGDQPEPALLARLLADWSLTLHRRGEPEQAQQRASQAMAAAEAGVDEPGVLMQIHNLLGILARSRGETATARGHLEASLALAERMENSPQRAAALNNLALVHRDLGDIPTAIQYIESALELCNMTGDLHRAAALRNNLADLLQAAGRSQDAQAQVKEAVQLFVRVGLDMGQWQPEIWKLVEW